MQRTQHELVLLAVPRPSSALLAGIDAAGFDVMRAVEAPDLIRLIGSVEWSVLVLDQHLFPGGVTEMSRHLSSSELRNRPAIVLVEESDSTLLEKASSTSAMELVSRLMNDRLLIHLIRRAVATSRREEERDRADARFARARRMAGFASWEWNLESGDFSCDPELLDIFELSRDRGTVQISELLERVYSSDRARVESAWRSRRPHQLEYRIATNGGQRRHVVQQEADLAQDQANGEVRLLGTVLEITQLKEVERRIARLVYSDSLTGLPNRTFLDEHLLRVIAQARRQQERVAVMGIDLDLFKRINDTLGHAAGDSLLKEVGRRISSAVRHGDAVVSSGHGTLDVFASADASGGNAVVRLGGDEFIVILNDLRSPEDAGVVARRIAEKLVEGVLIDGVEVFIGCSIGIALYPENGDSPSELLKHADAAMYEAKERGRNNFQFFTESINERAHRRMKVENGLRSALAKGDLRMEYQPKVEMRTGKAVGVEALLRWSSNEGVISPAEFVPIAEDTGLIVPIGEWTLRTVCHQAKKWLDGGRRLPVAVNVSSRQLREEGFADMVASILLETELPPELLEIEITESSIIQASGQSQAVLRKLKEIGVSIALEDFGTGYSSLGYLSDIPIDTLKIDLAFVKNLTESESCRAITAMIIALSRTLDVDLVAMGVENEAQIAFLLEHGCERCQGFLFSPAVHPDQVAAWYDRGSAG